MDNNDIARLLNDYDPKKSARKSRTAMIAGALASGAVLVASKRGVPLEVGVTVVGPVVTGLAGGLLNALKHNFPRVFGWL